MGTCNTYKTNTCKGEPQVLTCAKGLGEELPGERSSGSRKAMREEKFGEVPEAHTRPIGRVEGAKVRGTGRTLVASVNGIDLLICSFSERVPGKFKQGPDTESDLCFRRLLHRGGDKRGLGLGHEEGWLGRHCSSPRAKRLWLGQHWQW